MHTVVLPKIEPNMEEAMIVQWRKKEGDVVAKGEILFEIETAKAVVEVESEAEGIVRKILVPEGRVVPILTPVAFIGTSDEVIPDSVPVLSVAKSTPEEIKASPAARRLAREHAIDITKVRGTGPEGRIVEEDVSLFLERQQHASPRPVSQETSGSERKRVLIIGAGNGGEVVAAILKQNHEIIGFLDDNEVLWKKQLAGKLIFGGLPLLDSFIRDKKFDAVIISITSNMKIRRKMYEHLTERGCTFVNAIHPTAFIDSSVQLGRGNIIGAFVNIGYSAVIGNDNLVSAHCDIEHHNVIGDHTLFGPGVMTSGDVSIGSNCSLGAGVNIEPHIMIGDDVAIASGSTIINDVASGEVIRGEFTKRG